MVQRKVANNKLGIQPNITLKTEKTQQNNTNSSLHNHEGKNKGADFKAVRMKKSRLIKQSDVNISLLPSPENHKPPRQPGKPPTLITPTPKKPSLCKTPYTFPNYMKSTSSSEARKEKNNKVSSNSNASRFQGVAKILIKTSSFKKVRTLTKCPSFKHTRTSTCSSTLKDSKFPPYLKLKPGATEAQGKSVLRVCSYNYCSLNGHHHKSSPPLKRFLSLKRRVLKSLKVNRPEALTPCKGNKDFFVEIHVPNNEVATQVSESLSDGPYSEIDFQDEVDHSKNTNLSEMNHIEYKEEGIQPSFESDLEVESFPCVSLEEFFCENSDIEWEEGDMYTTNDKGEILIESNDQGELAFETDNSFGGYLGEFHVYPPYFHDEIVEFACFSDADSVPGSESSQTGEKNEEPVKIEEKDKINAGPNIQETFTMVEEATILAADLAKDSIDKQDGYICNHVEEVTEAHNEDLEFYEDTVESDANKSNEHSFVIGETREENATEIVKEEREPSESKIKHMPQITENLETFGAKGECCDANNDGLDGTDQGEDVAGEKENEVDNCVSTRSANSEDENSSKEIKLRSVENNIVNVKAPGMEDINGTAEAEASPATRNKQEASKCNTGNGESEDNQKLLDSSNILKRGIRSRKTDEDVEEEREFNPRGPNFLEIEPDPEAEKVDLRHQEMDDRRNVEEWMLDYALQKTVNQLATARNKKVALLVEAFEAVLPESSKSPGTIQTCS